MHPFHLRMLLQESGNLQRACLVLLHPQVKSLQAEVKVKRVLRTLNAAEIAHQMYSRFRDIRSLSKRIGVHQAVIRGIGRTQRGKLIRMIFPRESAAIHNRASHLHAMPIHIFGGAVGNDIRTPLYRSATYRCRKRVIHNQGHSMLMRDARKTFDIKHAHTRVTQSLAKYEFGILAESRLQHLIARILVNKRHLYAHFLKCSIEKIVGTAIN